MDAIEIARGLSADERTELAWWMNYDRYLRGKGVMFGPSATMEALHQKKLIWSPRWLPATHPKWVIRHEWRRRLWNAVHFNKRTHWITALIHPLPKVGPTKLGRRVAAVARELE